MVGGHRPVWVSVGARHLPVVVHPEPGGDSPPRSVVVLAAPVGREAVTAHRSLLVLAARLAAAGHRVLRFSWSGQRHGEAAADDLAQQWRADLAAVIDHAAATTAFAAADRPGPPVHLVGLRLGAALVVQAEHPRVGARVLWQPVGGAAFVRLHRGIRRLTLPGSAVEGLVELDGTAWSRVQADSVAALPDPEPLARQHGWPVRTEEPQVAELLHGVDPMLARVPEGSVDWIVEQLQQRSPAVEPGPARTGDEAEPAVDRQPAPHAVEVGGVRHSFVEVGAPGRPGLLLEPQGPPRGAVLVAALGVETALSASSPWSALTPLAEQGYAVLHLERPPHGECADPEVLDEPHPYRPESVEAVRLATTWLQQRYAASAASTLPVHGVGICAGAWAMLGAAAEPGLTSVWAVNNRAWHPDRWHYDVMFRRRARNRALGVSTPSGQQATTWRQRAARAVRTGQRRARAGAPLPVLRWLARRTRLDYGGSMLERLAPTTAVTLVLGPEDAEWFASLRGPDAVRALRRAGRPVQLSAVDGLDHSLLTERARRAGVQAVVDGILAHSGRPASGERG